jgi:hypothetical protein
VNADEVGVVVSVHAQERFRERHPDAANHRSAASAVYALVKQALQAQRMSKSKPSWIRTVERTSSDGRTTRYVWDEGESTVAVIAPAKQYDRERFKRCWFVLTVIHREMVDTERIHLARQWDADRQRRMKSGMWDTGVRAKHRTRNRGRHPSSGKRPRPLDNHDDV